MTRQMHEVTLILRHNDGRLETVHNKEIDYGEPDKIFEAAMAVRKKLGASIHTFRLDNVTRPQTEK